MASQRLAITLPSRMPSHAAYCDQIHALKPGDKPTKQGDGGGLLLVVNPNGSKLWLMVYRYGGKQKQLAFGAWPDITLTQARALRDAAKKLLTDDVDPSQRKQRDKIAKADAAINSFEALAEELLEKNSREEKSQATLNRKRRLIGLALKDLQSKPIGGIHTADILVALRRVEALGNHETARRKILMHVAFKWIHSNATCIIS